METAKSKDRSKVYLIAIIVVLLAMNAFFIYHYVNTDKELAVTTEELADVQEARSELDAILKSTQEELELNKGKNAELDSLLVERNREIQEKAAQIQRLMRTNGNYKEELEKLRYYVKKYQQEIADLTEKNEKLQKENKQIQQNLSEQRDKNEELTMKNINLENKVNLGKKMSFTAFTVEGVNRRSSGRETETNRARRVDLLKIEFTLDLNYLTDLGMKKFYLRIITPEGTTLSSENLGGGTFSIAGEEYLYTMIHETEFDNSGQSITFYYDKGSEWEKGLYKAEVYAEGFLIGTKEIKLR